MSSNDAVTAGRDQGRITTSRAPSDSPWNDYFGPPNKPIYTNPYAKQEYETLDLPDAWNGKNLFLRDTIDGFITDGNDWFTTKALPYQQHDGRSISWNKFSFNQTLAGVVPEEGVSRRITSSNESRSEATVRHGLSFVLEHGFMGTPEGRTQYLRNIQGIAQCVQETNNYDVLSALLHRGQSGRVWRDRHGSDNPYFNWKTLAKRQVGEWGIVQKSNDGLSVLHEEYKKRLHRSRCTANMWIFPSKMMLYTSMDPGSIDYKENMHAGPGCMSSFRGVPVYEAREFEVDELHIDLLRRRSQIGELYHMTNPHVDGKNYQSRHMTIKVYDEDKDDWGQYTLTDALRHCRRFDGDGNLSWPEGWQEGDDYTKPDLFTSKGSGSNLHHCCTSWGGMDPKHMPADMWRMFGEGCTQHIKTTLNSGINYDDLEQAITNWHAGAADPPSAKAGAKPGAKTPVVDKSTNLIEKNFELRKLYSAFKSMFTMASPLSYEEWIAFLFRTTYETDAAGVKSAQLIRAVDLPTSGGSYHKYWLSDDGVEKISEMPDTTKDAIGGKFNPCHINREQFMSRRGASKNNKRAAATTGLMSRSTAAPNTAYGVSSDGYESSTAWQQVDKYASAHTSSIEESGLMFLGQLFAWGLYHARINQRDLSKYVQLNIPLPVSFIFARTRMTYDMGSAIMMKGGTETGNTFVGNNDFQLGDDINTKVHHGHYTYYSKAIVKNPDNVMIAHDVFAMGYAGGNDCTFRSADESDGGTEHESRGATVVLMVPFNERLNKSNPLNVFSASPCGQENSQEAMKHTCSSAHYYGTIWGHQPDTPAAAGNMTFAAETVNTGNGNDLCWQGHQMNWDAATMNGFTTITKNTGHWGPKVYPGCGQVRSGQIKYFDA